MKTITLKQLKDLKACKNQVVLFEQLFGEQVEITVEACVAVADQFEFDWAIRKLLNEEGNEAYEEAIAPHEKIYEEVIATHLKTYKEAAALHWKTYEEAQATAFAQAYLTQ